MDTEELNLKGPVRQAARKKIILFVFGLIFVLAMDFIYSKGILIYQDIVLMVEKLEGYIEH